MECGVWSVVRIKTLTKIRIPIMDILMLCLLCVLVAEGFICFDGVKQYSSISLRFDTPISGQAAYLARQYSITHIEDKTFWPTFWTEYKSSFSSEFAVVETLCVSYSGDASLVQPATFIFGTSPGVLDGNGCAVSEALAWRLWGCTDVVGMSVEVDGTERVVLGVFKWKTELAIISYSDNDTTQSWSAVELGGGPENAVRGDAEHYASASGLGKPTFILMGAMTFLAGAMAALPLLVIACFGFGLLIGFVRKRYPTARIFILFLTLFLFAIFLPAMLTMLPGWMIPTRWSDFSFWGSLLTQASGSLREFLSARPQSRDVELRLLLLKQAGVMFVAVCFSIAVCFKFVLNKTEKM